MIKLRKYQQECLDAIARDLLDHTRIACVLSVGLGKTVIFSHLAARYAADGVRTLILVHRDELAEQAKTKLLSVDPTLNVGIVKAERNEVDADVIIGSVQTLARSNRREQLPLIGLVIIDECHHASARTYLDVLEHFGCFGWGDSSADPHDAPPEPATSCVGFTATLHREDGRGLGNVFEKVSYERDVEWGIDHGYLCDVRGQQVTIDGFNLAQIAKARGDYREGRLGDALEEIGAGEVIARAYKEHATKPDGSLRQGVLFAPTVSSAETFAEDMDFAGINTALITGDTPKDERTGIFKLYERGEIDVLCNVMVLTEGWDMPQAEVAVIARPTQNPALWLQMAGRVLRPFPGKTEALILDVVGIAGNHQLRTLANLTKVNVEPGESLVEAQERAEREHFEVERQRLEAPHASREVELFSASHSVWLQTKAGVWFISTSAGVWFLWPEPGGLYKIGYKSHRRFNPRESGWVVETPMVLTYAMSHVEHYAEEEDPTVALRDRAWRKAKPSTAQLDLAARLKVGDISEIASWRRGAVSDAISVHIASKMLDKYAQSA